MDSMNPAAIYDVNSLWGATLINSSVIQCFVQVYAVLHVYYVNIVSVKKC